MAYENVDVASAKTAINQCLNSLHHDYSSQMISDLKSNSNWISESKNTLINATETLVNVRYKELEEYLKKCLVNLDNIAKVQEMQSQGASYSSQIDNKRTELNRLNKQYSAIGDKTTPEVKDMKNKIDRLNSEIRTLDSKKNSTANDLASINRNIVI